MVAIKVLYLGYLKKTTLKGKMVIKVINSWFLDDITWCRSDCDNAECFRNPIHMIEAVGIHSWAYFKGTNECPVFDNECTVLKNEYPVSEGEKK